MEVILVALITAGIPSITTIASNLILKRNNDMHSARQSILQLIVEDKIRVIEGKLPENHQAILDDFDIYKKKGGNSYVKEKVDAYSLWYNNLQKKRKEN